MIYVVILNWNGWKDTITCLESLFFLRGVRVRLVVCDNESPNDSVLRIRDWCAGAMPAALAQGGPTKNTAALVTRPLALVEYGRAEAERGGDALSDAVADVFLLHTGGNLGFAGGCNVGIRFAMARGDASHVWLLNNDTVVESDALAQLVATADMDDDIGIVGSTLCFFDAPDTVQSYGGGTFVPGHALSSHIGEGQKHHKLSDAEVTAINAQMDYVVGASMLVTRRFLETVGLMQDDYFLYFEEMDWAERARRCSPPFRIALAADSIVYHKMGASVGQYSQSLLSVRYYTINRLRFLKRFYPRYLMAGRLRLLREGTGALLRGRVAAARLIFGVALSPVRV